MHALLLAITLFTTTISGAVIAGALPAELGLIFNPVAWDFVFWRACLSGFAFSLPLLAILLSHELGHYLTARRYQVNASPPHFLPGPPMPIGVGTFGAFIRLRTILSDRRQLLDIGAAGPIAGFIVAVPVLWIGLAHSHVATGPGAVAGGMQVPTGWGMWVLGDSAVTLFLRHLTHGNAALTLSPMAFAGWLGMLVTMLNLLPIAQLDGGHILYSAFPRAQRQVARIFWVLVILLGYLSKSWLVWAFIVLILSRGQFGHPPVLDAYRPLPKSRIWILVASLILFAVTFVPAPS
ncbi:MAG TPA: site-2 protease family protein [Gemmatimonadales bacterium]|jgi:membrane-associated protease RseP (regulator of RpoE activity)|nr:site-2 protease family protein [Gemmatimonadales bacterium]